MKPKAYSYICFSTPEQEKGDSFRRQMEQSERYAAKHGLTLDDSLKLTDKGLSAFHGAHRTKGALGTFLSLVEQGHIAEGSILIIENLDRLSREQVFDAMLQFMNIIHAGIKIITSQDGMEFTRDSINQNSEQLSKSVNEMTRAYAESERKSYMMKEAWAAKREQAIKKGGCKMTCRCPVWLKPVRNNKKVVTHYEPIEKRVQIINLIFDMKLEGKGSKRTARELNQSDLWKPRGRNGRPPSWRENCIDNILHNNRSVIGEFQQQKFKTKDGKRERIPVEDPILDYYPVFIDKEKFNRAQQ